MNIEVATGEEGVPLRAAILEGLLQYNERFLGPRFSAPLVVAVRDEAGHVVGGAVGGVHYDRLAVDLLWVDEAHRGRGLGSEILRAIEEEGRKRGATRCFLDTFTFQAAPFYEKLGYVEVARIEGYFGEYDRIYYRKTLTP